MSRRNGQRLLDRVEFGGASRQRQQGDVGWHCECLRGVPAGLIEQQDGVRAGGDGLGDLGQMPAHRLGGAAGHDRTGPGAFGRADRPDNGGRGGALGLGCRRPRAAFGPAPGDRVLLADPGLIGESDLYRRAADSLGGLRQAGGPSASDSPCSAGPGSVSARRPRRLGPRTGSGRDRPAASAPPRGRPASDRARPGRDASHCSALKRGRAPGALWGTARSAPRGFRR